MEARQPIEAPQEPEWGASSPPHPPDEPPAAPPAELDTNKPASKAKQATPRPPRASPTDPETRRMKMADGGSRHDYST